MKVKYVSWDECADGPTVHEADIPGAENMRPDHILHVINVIHAEMCESVPLTLKDAYGYKEDDPGWLKQVGSDGLWAMRGWWSDRTKVAYLIYSDTGDVDACLEYANGIEE